MRQRDTLRYDQTLFYARKAFEFTCLPDEVHHRDAQVRELARPALQGGSPKSAVLRGPPATGKYLDEAVRLAATIKKNFEGLGV